MINWGKYSYIANLLINAKFVHTKKMPQNPHWYTLRKDWNDNDFINVVKLIRDYGYSEYWNGKEYKYFNVNGYKYWTMGAPINLNNKPYTILINKAKLVYNAEYDKIADIYDDKNDKYIIVDGFHRYYVMKTKKDIYDSTNGLLPIVVIDKPINSRMASTIRHNRARGKHNMMGMANLVFKMLENGWNDDEICNELGMEAEEILRLKHITGFSKLFKDHEYNKAWITKRQIKLKNDFLSKKTDNCTQKDTT